MNRYGLLVFCLLFLLKVLTACGVKGRPEAPDVLPPIGFGINGDSEKSLHGSQTPSPTPTPEVIPTPSPSKNPRETPKPASKRSRKLPPNQRSQ